MTKSDCDMCMVLLHGAETWSIKDTFEALGLLLIARYYQQFYDTYMAINQSKQWC